MYSNEQNLVNNFWRFKEVAGHSKESIKYPAPKFPAEFTIYKL